MVGLGGWTRQWRLAAMVLVAVAASGCKEDPAPIVEDEESSGEPVPPIGFVPSNLVLDPFYDVADVIIPNDCTIRTTGGGSLCNADPSDFVFFEQMQSDGTMIGVFVVENLAIAPDVNVEIRGDVAVALVAQSTIVNEGTILLRPGENGGAVSSAGGTTGVGEGAGTGIEGPVQGGGGAGYCGRGGNAGDGSGAGGTYGTAAIVPLWGGSSGGERNSGGGGGALQLVAGLSIVNEKSLTVPGGGGEDGGGGSGGALLLEAPMVTLRGRIAANSGGGASGDKTDGVTGKDRFNSPAAGGQGGGATPGGQGSAGDDIDGAEGAATVMTDQEFGSGGGGAGWIRINTESGVADIAGSVSPSFASGCASEGTLG